MALGAGGGGVGVHPKGFLSSLEHNSTAQGASGKRSSGLKCGALHLVRTGLRAPTSPIGRVGHQAPFDQILAHSHSGSLALGVGAPQRENPGRRARGTREGKGGWRTRGG